MKHYLFPDELQDSIFRIDFDALHRSGVRGVIMDIDNTLVGHGEPADGRALALFQEFRRLGLKTCLISNNREPRVKSFAAQVGSPYIFKAGKPKPGGYREAMKLMGTAQEETVFVGDQIFTDVLGARIAGIYSILTRPLYPKEEIQIVLKRIPERLVLFFYGISRKKT